MAAVQLHARSAIYPVGLASQFDGECRSKAAARFTPSRFSDPSFAALGRESAIATAAPAGAAEKPSPLKHTDEVPPEEQCSSASLTPHQTSRVLPATEPGSTTLLPSSGRPRVKSVPPPPRAGEPVKPMESYIPQYEYDIETAQPTIALSPPSTVSPSTGQAPSLTLTIPPRQSSQQAEEAHHPEPALSHCSSLPRSTTFPEIAQDLSHPPGYIQDSRASFSDIPYQEEDNLGVDMIRRSTTFKSLRGRKQRTRARSSCTNGGILDGSGGHADELYDDEDDENDGFLSTHHAQGLWGTALTWAKTLGDKVVEGEEQIWKTVNEYYR